MWFLIPNYVLAADTSPLVGGGSSQMLTVIGALLLVIAAIYASVWGIKRLGNFTQQGGGGIKLLSGVMVGPKERVVLVECGGKKLLLGVATGQVNLLHQFHDSDSLAEGGFGDVLQRVGDDELSEGDEAVDRV